MKKIETFEFSRKIEKKREHRLKPLPDFENSSIGHRGTKGIQRKPLSDYFS